LATLVGSAGGFATFFNLIGITVMRTYNRVSIFLAFLALMAIFSIIDDLIRRYACRGRRLVLANLGLAGLLVMGLYDQSGAVYIPPFEHTAKEYRSDAEFIARVESSVPPNTMVFQLPYIAYASYQNAYQKMQPYCLLRAYLHSHSIRWSFGAMHGRSSDTL